MKHYRIVLGIVLLLSLVLAAACGRRRQTGAWLPMKPRRRKKPQLTTEVVEIEETEEEAMELSGEIVVSIASNDVQTYQAIADAYMELHPNVEVLVELKAPGVDAYLQWIRTQFTSEVPRVSIIESPHLREFAQEGRLVDWGPYLNKENPYTGAKWEDSFEEWGLNLVRDPNTGQMFTMPYMSVQTFWLYNQALFEQAGITDVPPQPTWDQFVEWNEKLRDSGVIPIAMEGTTEQIWGGGRMPWLMRSAMDQYHRDELPLIQCQEGDWCFREGIDDIWEYDPTDVRNDDPDRVSVNISRHLSALRDGEINFDNECTVEMMTEIGRVFQTANGFVPEGWTGMTDAYPLFLTQKAAMRMVHGGIYTSLPKDIRALAQGAVRWLSRSDRRRFSCCCRVRVRTVRVSQYRRPLCSGNCACQRVDAKATWRCR